MLRAAGRALTLLSQPDALFVAPTPFLSVRLVQLAQLAAFHRLPSTHYVREYAEAGGLMSYGSNIGDTYRQVWRLCWPHSQGCADRGFAGRAVKQVRARHQRLDRQDAGADRAADAARARRRGNRIRHNKRTNC